MDKQVIVRFNQSGKERRYHVSVLLGVQGNQIMAANPFYVVSVSPELTDDEYRKLAIKYNLPDRIKHEPETRNHESVVADATETPDTTTVLKIKRPRKTRQNNGRHDIDIQH